MKKNQKSVLLMAVAILIATALFVNFGGIAYIQQQGGTVQFQATVTYTDGTTRTFSNPTTNLFTVTDPDTDKAVSKIVFDLYVTPVFSGTVTQITVTGKTRHILLQYLQYGGVVSVWTGEQESFTYGDSNAESGVPIKVKSITVITGDIDGKLTGKPTGTYGYGIGLDHENYVLAVTLMFDDGHTETRNPATSSTDVLWNFHYSSGSFTSLSVGWNTNPS